ncbi:MAG: DUF4450 domain-containing protein [Bacteroidetes bacterium]|nr:DUF4450 domain-containing protein [Bacteroidota bacterium]
MRIVLHIVVFVLVCQVIRAQGGGGKNAQVGGEKSVVSGGEKSVQGRGGESALTGGIWHGRERVLRYRPEGGDFVIVNGERRFNRALYGTNTAFRVEAGDLPEFALYMPGMGGCFRLGLVRGDSSKWLIGAKYIKAKYRPGSMIYEIRDPLLGDGLLELTLLAEMDREGLVLRLRTEGIDSLVRLVAVFGGASGKKFSRDGDIGADPESSFYLQPEYCRGNRFGITGKRFQLSYGEEKSIAGVLPEGARLRVGDAGRQGSPVEMLRSAVRGEGGGESATPVMVGEMGLAGSVGGKTGSDRYILLYNAVGNVVAAGEDEADLQSVFLRAEMARKKLTERVVVHTPDPYINTLGGALAVAADGIWEDPSYLHGAVAWRMRLPAWRGPYVADPLGWHDRARRHFSSYSASQVKEPEDGPVIADTALHLARQLEKMGTALFSSGYICRNPGGDIRPHHYDMNLVFIDQLLDHFYWTGDTAYVREMWPVIERHLAWEKRNFDGDDDGLYDAYCCIWASDALEYSGGGVTHSSAYNYRANLKAAELARLIGVDGGRYRREAEKILRAVNNKLWLAGVGSYAEYVDWVGVRKDGVGGGGPVVHPAAGLWTIYHAIDEGLCSPWQAWQALHYVDVDIPHIPVRARGLEDTSLYVLSTTSWQPYTWSVNNVAMAEVLHTALAYWQGGRAESAWPLWKGALVESMYLGASPGNFQQLSFYDAVRGELYRDFGDPIGMAARSLVEGLFGIKPDALHDTLTVAPGWPMDWGEAKLHIPDVDVEFDRSGARDVYKIASRFRQRMNLKLRLRVRGAVGSVRVNGKEVGWRGCKDVIGDGVLEVVIPPSATWEVVVEWGREEVAKSSGETVGEGRTMFVRMKQGMFDWWKPVVKEERVVERRPVVVKGGTFEAVDLGPYFNDVVTNVFTNEYKAPRPVTPTLQLPLQGIGNWCYPLVTAGIDDAGLRAVGKVVLPSGVFLMTPSAGKNVLFTSRWDNYPDSAVVSLKGKAGHAWLMMAGTTNPMQSRIENGRVEIYYKDGMKEVLPLVNPTNWWPIEQDYYTDGFAFTTGAERPWRVELKTGKPSKEAGKWTTIKGFTNTAVDGGAATVLDLPLRRDKELDRLVVRASANDVVVGLMSVTLQRQ